MFLWLSLPPGPDASRLREVALAQGVTFVPEAPLHPPGGGADTLRLNFSHGDPRRIAEGVCRPGAAFRNLQD
jgi:2-aminoadipate transaminase